MDALEFVKERQRMYKSYGEGCLGCPMDGGPCGGYRGVDAERLVGAVEKWSAEHPHKTRQSEFLKQFPNVTLDGNGIINISPCRVDPKQYPFNGKGCCKFWACINCRREFWLEEIE